MPRQPHDAAAELRDLIREANGVLKDLERERKAAAELLSTSLIEALKAELSKQVDAGLAELSGALSRLVDRAETTINARLMFLLKQIMSDTLRLSVDGPTVLEAIHLAAALGTDLTGPEYRTLFSLKSSPQVEALADELEERVRSGADPASPLATLYGGAFVRSDGTAEEAR